MPSLTEKQQKDLSSLYGTEEWTALVALTEIRRQELIEDMLRELTIAKKEDTHGTAVKLHCLNARLEEIQILIGVLKEFAGIDLTDQADSDNHATA